MLDASILKSGQDFSELPNRCIIVLTEKDFNSNDPMIQHIKKVDLMSGNVINSGEEEIIVNLAAATNDSELGQFIRDWTNSNPDDIKNPVLAEAFRSYKSSPKGVHEMYTKWEEAQHEDRINFVSVMLERFSPEEIADKMGWDNNYIKALKSEIDSKKESN